MIHRLRLKTEAEPRRPCVPRREPGNENGARVGGNGHHWENLRQPYPDFLKPVEKECVLDWLCLPRLPKTRGKVAMWVL